KPLTLASKLPQQMKHESQPPSNQPAPHPRKQIAPTDEARVPATQQPASLSTPQPARPGRLSASHSRTAASLPEALQSRKRLALVNRVCGLRTASAIRTPY